MARYIDADALIERLKFKRDETDKVKKKYSGLECAISQVQKQPTADVVEVVRCKECVFWDVEKTGLVDECVCKMHSVVKVHSRYTNPTDYCSYGERKCNDD
jgi:hypothetical protein